MTRRNWSTAYKTELLQAYVRILRQNSNSLTAHGVDSIANRAQFLHMAQDEVCKDEELRRDIGIPFATMFLRSHKSIIESVRPLVDIKLRNAGLVGVPTPAKTEALKQPVGFVIDNSSKETEMVDQRPTEDYRPYSPPARNYSVQEIITASQTLSNAMEVFVNALRPLTAIPTDDLVKAITQALSPASESGRASAEPEVKMVETIKVVEKIVEVPAARGFVSRKPGELRTVFDPQPSVVIAGFRSEFTNNVSRQLKGILPYIRAQTSALMQCLAEHPDTSVLILADDIKVNPRIEYLTSALDIQVISVANTREALMEAIDHVNGYTLVSSEPQKPITAYSNAVDLKDNRVPELQESEPSAEDVDRAHEYEPGVKILSQDRPVIFITHPHNAQERNTIRLRFVETLDVRYCDAAELHHALVGHNAPTVLHYSSVRPMMAVEIMSEVNAVMIHVRSQYMDVFSKLCELEKLVQKIAAISSK